MLAVSSLQAGTVWNACWISFLPSPSPSSEVSVVLSCCDIVETVLPTSETALSMLCASEALPTASSTFLTLSSSSFANWSTCDCASLPACVFGRPRPRRSSVSFFVAVFAWSTPFVRESFVTPLCRTDETVEVIELLHVFTDVQSSLAHFWVGVVSLLLPPQPAATTDNETTTATRNTRTAPYTLTIAGRR